MKTWIYPSDFSIGGTPNPSYVRNQFFATWSATEIWGTVTADMGKFLLGSEANIYLGNVMGSVPKKFQAVLVQW